MKVTNQETTRLSQWPQLKRPYDLEDFRKPTKSASGGKRIIMEIDGAKAAIAPVEDFDYMEALEDAEDLRDGMKAMEDLSDTIPIEDVIKEYIVVAATHDTSYQNDAGGIKASSRWLSEATPPVMRWG
jgi:hypothetical protein